jgi:hypothetical protein
VPQRVPVSRQPTAARHHASMEVGIVYSVREADTSMLEPGELPLFWNVRSLKFVRPAVECFGPRTLSTKRGPVLRDRENCRDGRALLKHVRLRDSC